MRNSALFLDNVAPPKKLGTSQQDVQKTNYFQDVTDDDTKRLNVK